MNATTAPVAVYQNENPWSLIGKEIVDPAINHSVPAFLEAAGLDWTVTMRKMYYRERDKSLPVPQRRAVVRDTDGKLLATVGAKYVPFQNIDAFAVLQPACDQFGLTLTNAGAYGRGDRVWLQAKLPKSIEPIQGDVIDNYLLINTGHNGWTGYSASLMQMRLVCTNGLKLAVRDGAFVKLRHVITEVDRLKQVSELISGFMHVAQATGESYKKLAGHKLNDAETKSYIETVLNLDYENPVAARRRDTIFELSKNGKGVELAPGTMWTAFNAITEYIDHVRPAEAKAARTVKQANESALFGQNAKIKVRALEVARKIVA